MIKERRDSRLRKILKKKASVKKERYGVSLLPCFVIYISRRKLFSKCKCFEHLRALNNSFTLRCQRFISRYSVKTQDKDNCVSSFSSCLTYIITFHVYQSLPRRRTRRKRRLGKEKPLCSPQTHHFSASHTGLHKGGGICSSSHAIVSIQHK